ncbi:junctional sarcoplasmic reticulum protein 1 [Orycteropus afer afer]|uniref:Junctional sarcoplasmic reticulum protein 1 n=1 Tax=Orycteropus afer afer TaxID=1230840 RepID=A0A8B7AMN1_ORYAF|nr:junctional sarcoplasmic reticulum protein 1 [Orycteropus afer afer]
MTTRALEELDGGLGSCPAEEDLSLLADPCPGQAQEDKAQGTSRLADLSSWPHDSPPAAEGRVDTKSKKMEKEPAVKGAPSPKEKLKAGATPRSAPARKKSQAAPPPKQPPPPPPQMEELPWGDMSLNKCLVLATLVALLGSAFQLCHDTVIGKVAVPEPAREPWLPPSGALKARETPPQPPKPEAWTPPPASPAPQKEAEARSESPRSGKAAEEAEEEASEATGETPGKAQVDQGPKEKPPGKERRKERPRSEKEERPRKARPQREKEQRPRRERPRADREGREAPPRRRESREGGHRPRARDSRDAEHRASKKKGQTFSEEEERPGRQKHRAGKGRD